MLRLLVDGFLFLGAEEHLALVLFRELSDTLFADGDAGGLLLDLVLLFSFCDLIGLEALGPLLVINLLG